MAETDLELYCLIVPMRDKPILIPNQALAEIVPFIDSEPPPENHKPWHVGYLHWRGMLLPVISYEAIYKPTQEKVGRQKMVAILHTQLGLKHMPYFGIMVEGIPRLSTVTRDTIEHRDPQKIDQLHDVILADVKLGTRELLIPDINAIEWLIDKNLHNQ